MVSPTGSFLSNSRLEADADFGSTLHDIALSLLPSDPSPKDLWDRAKPTLATRANLAVFAYELRDLKRMFMILPKKHFNLRRWKDVVKYGNDLHLNWMFGWRPFLSDIKKFFRGMSSFEERLTRFVTQANQDISRHRWKGPITTSLHKEWTLPYSSNWKAVFDGSVNSTYAAAFQFSYSIPDYSERELHWRGMLDTLGANVTVANVWAVLPWSFVADWFVGIGPALENLSSDWVEPYIDMYQACTSAKWDYFGTLTLYPQGVFSGLPAQAGMIRGKRYARSLGIPGFQIVYPDLTADRIRLLSSLALSRLV